MEIEVVELPDDYLKAMKEFQSKQIIKDDPSNELLEIYQKRVLIDYSYLKMEKWYSPEHQEELEDLKEKGVIGKEIPKNVINPNFKKLMKLYEEVMEKKHESFQSFFEALQNLIKFVQSFPFVPKFDYSPCIYKPLMDVRFCQDLDQYFNYLLTFKYKEFLSADDD